MVSSVMHILVGQMIAFFPAVSSCHTAAESHRIAAEATVEALPVELRRFFVSRLEDFVFTANSERVSSRRLGGKKANNHFIGLDVVTDSTSTALETALRFPRIRSKADKLFEEHGIEDGGRLPWVLVEGHQRLENAFREGHAGGVLNISARILHYTIDTCMPFNTTTDADGRRTENRIWQLGDQPSSIGDHLTVWHRCQLELVRRNTERFSYEVRVLPGRVKELSKPAEAVIWEALAETHGTLSTFLAIDREILDQLAINTPDDFLLSADKYYKMLASRAGPIMETRLESAALLAAELITSAWIEAGRPSMPVVIVPENTRQGSAPQENAIKAAYLGSRESLIFHRPTCPHAKRIQHKNLVPFATVDQAVRAGRKPCKTCSPQTSKP